MMQQRLAKATTNTTFTKEIKYTQLTAFEAAQCGDIEALKNFTKHELEIKSSKDYSPLFCAIANGQLKTVKYLLEGVGVALDTHPRLGGPLHYAATLGELSIVKYLAEGPAKHFINDHHLLNGTPLDCAAEHGHLNIVKYLITEMKTTIVSNELLPTPLHLAAQNKHSAVVKYLIKGPAKKALEPFFYKYYILKNENDEDCDYSPPLHIAAVNGDLESVKCLIEEAKINPHIINQDNLTALEYSIYKGKPNDNLLNVLRYLIPKTHIRYGHTPLHWAVEEEKLPIVTMLLEEFKADIHVKNIWGFSALDRAKGIIKSYLETKKNNFSNPKKMISEMKEQKEYKLPSFHYYNHTLRRKSWCEYDEKIYVKSKKLGNGNCGEVYSFVEQPISTDEKMSSTPSVIAIKKTFPMPDIRPINFRQEAEFFHQVYGIGGHDANSKVNVTYTAMPLIKGISLDRVAITTLMDFYKISIAMVKALNELHVKHKIVHTDLNLGNFMVQKTSTNNYMVKLIDFGLSVNLGQLLPLHLFLNANLAPHYAPEVEIPIPADPKQDVFTLGFLLLNSLYNKAKLPSSQKPSYLKKMMCTDPDYRPSLDAIQKELETDLIELQEQQSISHHRAAFFKRSANMYSLPSISVIQPRKVGYRQ